MTRRAAAILAGAAAVTLVTVLGALLLAGDPPAPPPATMPSSPSTSPPSSPPSTTTPAAPLRPPESPVEPAAPGPPDRARAPTARGAALVAQVRAIVARGEGAVDDPAEQAAAADLAQVLADLEGRGEAALEDARALLDAAAPPGVQEVGARTLARIGSQAALEALTDLARGGAAEAVRLQALRALRASPLPFARGALVDVARDARAGVEVRSYALDLMRDLDGAEGILLDVATDAADDPRVRAAALDALLALDPARGREALRGLEGAPAVRAALEALQGRD